MKILHYLLGLPPVRGGGLVKYALDLVEAESKHNEVYLLIPGPIDKDRGKRNQICIRPAGRWKGVRKYSISNPLPIPMANGILDIEEFTLSCTGKVYREFLEKLQPDAIHIHTLMGLHKEFLVEAYALKLPMIYTAHDYFGICPTVNLFYKDEVCSCPGAHCEECSQYAFSEKRLLLEQSLPYRIYRNSNFLIQMLRTDFMKGFLQGMRSRTPEKAAEIQQSTENKQSQLQTGSKDYGVLLTYYREMFRLITYFHFNSNVTRQVYEQHLGKLPGEVLYISNKSVSDKRTVHEVGDKLKIGFMGGDVAFKGLQRLQRVIEELYNEGMTEIELQVYGSLEHKEYPFCKYYPAYKEKERDVVFERMDLLAVPSSWMETFGMVVREAIGYGVPVLATDKVGAKGLLGEGEGMLGIVLPDEDAAWKSCIADLYTNREKVRILSENIYNADLDLEFEAHVKSVQKLYGGNEISNLTAAVHIEGN